MEVLLVIILLVAAFIPLLQVFSSGLLVSNEVKGSNTAVILAQQKLGEIKNISFSAITNEAKAVISTYPAYQRQVIVTTPSTNLKDIMIIVYWKPGEGHETSVSIETFISNF